MSSEDLEITDYLRRLLDHEPQCQSAACPSCAALLRMVELVRGQLFSTKGYASEAAATAVLSACAGVTLASSSAWHIDWVL